MLLAVELEAVRVVAGRPGLHAQEGIVRLGVRAAAVVAVVRGDERGAKGAGDLDELRVGAVLVGQPVILQLDEQVVATEDVLQPAGELAGAGLLVGQQGLQDDAAEAPGRGDQADVMGLQHLPVDPGLVVVALQVGGRGELDEVAVAGVRLGQQGEVVVELLPTGVVPARVVHAAASNRPLIARVGSHVGLCADDRRDAPLAALLVEVEDPVHVSVVCDGERWLPVGDGCGHDVPDPRGAVEHRVFGVGVQMSERCRSLLVIHCAVTPCPQPLSPPVDELHLCHSALCRR